MAHARKTEDCLEALSRLRVDPTAPAARAEIGQYLAHKSNAVVAKAAQLVGNFELQDLRPHLVEAFHRFMKDPATADRGCAAKTAIVRALEALATPEEAIYLTGIRHIQMEGSFRRVRMAPQSTPRRRYARPAPWPWSICIIQMPFFTL